MDHKSTFIQLRVAIDQFIMSALRCNDHISASDGADADDRRQKRVQAALETSATAFSDSPLSTQSSSQSSSYPLSYKQAIQSSDVIHSIMQFLSFKDLIPVTCVSQQWKDATRSLRPLLQENLEMSEAVWQSVDVERIRGSALLPHVSAVLLSGWRKVPYRIQLQRLAVFPSLQKINDMHIMTIHPCRPAATKCLNPSLTTLHITVGTGMLQPVIDIICSTPSIKKLSFSVCVDSNISWDVNFNPLIKLKQLEKFVYWNGITFTDLRPLFPFDSSIDLTESHKLSKRIFDVEPLITVLRQMPSLVHLNDWCDGVRVNIQQLAQQPNELSQLQSVGPITLTTAADVEALLQFQALTAIDVRQAQNLYFLSKLPNLTNLCIYTGSWIWDPDFKACVTSVSQLRVLTVAHYSLDDSHLEALCSNAPQLQDLTLMCCAQVKKLSWLRPLASQLIRLRLNFSRIAFEEAFAELPKLQKLTSLSLEETFDRKLDQDELKAFLPPSALIPSLTEFSLTDSRQ